MTRYTQRAAGVPAETPLEQRLDERFPDERMERIYPNAILVDWSQPSKHSRTAQAAARKPVRSAHRAAGRAYRVRVTPTAPQ